MTRSANEALLGSVPWARPDGPPVCHWAADCGPAHRPRHDVPNPLWARLNSPAVGLGPMGLVLGLWLAKKASKVAGPLQVG